MRRQWLRSEPRLAAHFIARMLASNIRIERRLLAELFHLDSTEKRLARTLSRLAAYGTARGPLVRIPELPPERLARMVGMTRARVAVLMSRFQRLRFITRDGDIRVHPALVSIVLDD